MTLSVCCLTRDPGAQVAAALGQLRPVADEIIVAVDSGLDPDHLGRYAAVADRLLRYEFMDSAERAVPWLFAQCSGGWILLIDGDEVASPALVECLPELVRATDFFQYWLPTRWLFPDAQHYLAQPPWHYSSPRLVRNDPATLWHGGLSHGGADPVFPSRHLSDGFYHLALVIQDVSSRRSKVAHYLAIESTHDRRVLETDLPAFYLPEHDRAFGLAPVPVPARDRPAIDQVLAASGPELPGPPAGGIPLGTRAEIDRVWPRRGLAESAYSGRIDTLEPSPVLGADEQRPITLRVTNEGTESWPGLTREPWIKLSHRWVGRDGRPEWAPADTCLPGPVGPGQSALVPVPVRAPVTAGEHALEFSLVHEDPLLGRIFQSFAATRIPVELASAPRTRRGRLSGRRSPHLPRASSRGWLRRRPRAIALPLEALPLEALPLLTFDDGPSEWTEPLLEVLRHYSVRATFFVIGERARERPHLVEAVARDGHEIGNHTEDHSPLPLLPNDAEVAGRIVPTSDLIEHITGRRPRLFRPPFGLTNEGVGRVVASLGMQQMLWTRDTKDYASPGRAHIATTIVRAGPSDIVLLHDGGAQDPGCDRRQTVEGVARALDSLAQRHLHLH
jgi:peptidoglycan/xylan/chitin deacetylase (PgdA/CDA1 family)